MIQETKPLNFLQQIVKSDLEEGRHACIVTRFPPEPNGFLHIGHAKSIWVNFGLAQEFGGRCHLRFDDTNPEKEDQIFVDSIQRDVEWLGYQWDGEVRYASSYFEDLYQWAIQLIKDAKAYVCHLSFDEARQYRGTLTEPGRDSPYRNRSVDENLTFFDSMRTGEVEEGVCVLRAKIDMTHGNMNMRDPILYRVRKLPHHQTGDTWCIYPTYDFAHGQEDAIEGITHSVCTLEFADHRLLYEWFIENLPVPSKPRQYEFARLNLNYTVTSKRKLKQLVDEHKVDGWDDPRLPTIAGLRRRGYTPAALRRFCEMTGVTKSAGMVDVGMLEHAIRDNLDKNAPRAMCVLHPLKVTLTNYPEEKTEILQAPGHPNRDDIAERSLPFGHVIYIDQDDFRVEANKKYKRLVLNKRVRLRNAYVIEAHDYITNDAGNIIELKAKIIEGTVGKNPEDGNKPKGVIHWVAAHECENLEVRLYDRLFNDESPDSGDKNFLDHINPNSLTVLKNCKGEIGLQNAVAEQAYQFEREGYFCLDNRSGQAVFNRTIDLKDSWSKVNAKG